MIQLTPTGSQLIMSDVFQYLQQQKTIESGFESLFWIHTHTIFLQFTKSRHVRYKKKTHQTAIKLCITIETASSNVDRNTHAAMV